MRSLRWLLANVLQVGKRRDPPAGIRVTGWAAPYDYCHDRYQAYYAEGFRAYLAQAGGEFRLQSLGRFPRLMSKLRSVRHSTRVNRILGKASPALHCLLDVAAAPLGSRAVPPSGLFHPLVGQYVCEAPDGRLTRVCVDSQDSGDVACPALLDWADVYYKTNQWQDYPYSIKVRPCYNLNPLVLDRLELASRLRAVKPAYDLVFVVRVWGGKDEVEGVEHNLRLLEAVNRAPGKKRLLAYLVAGDLSAAARRLERQGIPWTTRPVPLEQLWQWSAESRLNVIRLGMHYCIPWRMTDLLAMGACPVLDQPPFTTWPRKLREDENYFQLNSGTPPGRQTAAPENYDAIPERIGQLLEKRSRIAEVRANNARYFDHFLIPFQVGQYLCSGAFAYLGRGPLVPQMAPPSGPRAVAEAGVSECTGPGASS